MRFQFTPLREGRHKAIEDEKKALDISIHAPPRGATDDVMNALKPILFQFTPLREGRHGFDTYIQRVGAFQFTPLREGRLGKGYQGFS